MDQLGGKLWETPNLESQRRTPVDAKHLCVDSLGHLARPESPNMPTAGGRADAGRAKISEDDGAAHAFDATHLYTDLLRHLEPRKEKARPAAREPPGDDKYMPTSYIWDSGQEITGVQGVVAGGVQFSDF